MLGENTMAGSGQLQYGGTNTNKQENMLDFVESNGFQSLIKIRDEEESEMIH